MARATLAILAVLIIPACDWRDSWDHDHEVSITNQGAASIWVEVCHYDDDGWGDERTFDFSLGAGDRRVDSYPWSHRVEVRIHGHDGALIFSRTYTPEDFENDGDRISIVVNP
jgi:hypothetical protein